MVNGVPMSGVLTAEQVITVVTMASVFTGSSFALTLMLARSLVAGVLWVAGRLGWKSFEQREWEAQR